MSYKHLFLSALLTVSSFADKSSVHITLLATNDIHGGIEATVEPEGQTIGGLAFWAGAVNAFRTALAKKHGAHSGVLLLDAGDQFQGTLLSNYDEGKLVFRIMNQMGYSAIVPGNHDYDFGPLGWLEDRPKTVDKRREAFEAAIALVQFPLLSANTYFTHSLVDGEGVPVTVGHKGCEVEVPERAIDWSKAEQPSFLVPYTVKEFSGVRVGVIGVDHPETYEVTTSENVSDLCFDQLARSYYRARAALGTKADVIVLVLHFGDAKNEKKLTDLVRALSQDPFLAPHAVISGHTHFSYNERINGIPVIQSGAGMSRFGRIDLVWDRVSKKIQGEKTRSWAGTKLLHSSCDPYAPFCREEKGVILYEGEAVVADREVQRLIDEGRKNIAPLSNRVIGHTEGGLVKDRIRENPLSNAVTDVFREITGADVAIINGGGVRTDLPDGVITYEMFFKVFPFSNRGILAGPLSQRRLLNLLLKSAQSCGSYSSLMQSGLRIIYERHCENNSTGVDESAKLIHVETLKGEVLFPIFGKERSFDIATLDYLLLGGERYGDFKGIPEIKDHGSMREVLVDRFLEKPFHWEPSLDGRWTNTVPETHRR